VCLTKGRAACVCVQDVWSLGVTLMECAMGRFPYPDTRNYIDLIHYITEGDVPTLRE
jgi:serine/threonine protein kinase